MIEGTNSTSKNIYFVRHGERIDWVDSNWVQTAEQYIDPPLSPHGIQQAKELAVHIAEHQSGFTYIYSSPFLRTIQTALSIAIELNKKRASSSENWIKIRIEPGYSEYLLCEAAEHEKQVFTPRYTLPQVLKCIEYFDQDYDGIIDANYYSNTKLESHEQLRERLQRTMQGILNNHRENCNIIIVTHAAPLIEASRAVLSMNEKRCMPTINTEMIPNTVWNLCPIRAGVCSLTHLELINDSWTIIKNGCTSHLSDGEQNIWYFPSDSYLYENL